MLRFGPYQHLRIGHTRLTNLYLLKGENQAECQICHSPLTVKNILIDCTVLHVRDILELIHSKNFLIMWNLETSLLKLLKIQTFIIVCNIVFTATCFSNVAVMGSLDVRLSVRPSVRPSVTLVIPDHIH